MFCKQHQQFCSPFWHTCCESTPSFLALQDIAFLPYYIHRWCGRGGGPYQDWLTVFISSWNSLPYWIPRTNHSKFKINAIGWTWINHLSVTVTTVWIPLYTTTNSVFLSCWWPVVGRLISVLMPRNNVEKMMMQWQGSTKWWHSCCFSFALAKDVV
jgi:hypothetical protein